MPTINAPLAPVLKRLLWALILLALPAMAQAQIVVGTAAAVDGDSLLVGNQKVRLFGIDAPEFDQTCKKDGQAWGCGQEAKRQLETLVSGQRIECQGRGVDTYNRILAVCSAGYLELNRTMAEQGWAIAFREFSDDYVAAEVQAKTQGIGIWSSTFATPSEYRHGQSSPEPRVSARPRPQPQRPSYRSPGGCVIKGNHSRRGEWIYHLPGMPYYEQTRAEEIFCSEAEAIQAGYRRARVRQ
jgi:endonuclease YncB( thermonuclease family)